MREQKGLLIARSSLRCQFVLENLQLIVPGSNSKSTSTETRYSSRSRGQSRSIKSYNRPVRYSHGWSDFSEHPNQSEEWNTASKKPRRDLLPSEIYPAGFPGSDDDDDFPDLAIAIDVSAKHFNFQKSAWQPHPRAEDDENSFEHFTSAKFNQNRALPRLDNNQRTVIDLDFENDLQPSPVHLLGSRSRSFNSIPDPRSNSTSSSAPLNHSPLHINTFPSSEQRRPALHEREPFNPVNIQDFNLDDDEALRAAIAASLADMDGLQPSSYYPPPNPPPRKPDPPPKPAPAPPVQRKLVLKTSSFVSPDTLFQFSPSTSPVGTAKPKASQVTQTAEPVRSKVQTASSRLGGAVVRDDTRRLLEELEKVTSKPRKIVSESPEPKRRQPSKKHDENLALVLDDENLAPKPKPRSKLTQQEKVPSV